MFKLKVKYRNDDKAEGKYLISRGTQDCIHIHLASIDSAMQQNTPNPEPHYYPLNLNHTVRKLTKPISKLWRNKWLVQWKGSEMYQVEKVMTVSHNMPSRMCFPDMHR